MTDSDSIEWPDAAPAPLAKAPRRSREGAKLATTYPAFDDLPKAQQEAMRASAVPVHPADEEGEIYTPPPYVATRPVPAIGRTLPADTDAEECLISACTLDDGETLDKAKAAGLEPSSFYEKAHGTLYAALLSLRADGQPLTADVLAMRLTDQKLLAGLGGYPFLARITGKTPTTAEAAVFISRVREQSILRNLIRSATGVVEDCYNFSGGIDDFLAEQSARVNAAANGYQGPQADALIRRAYNPKAKLEKPTPIYLLAGTTISTPGNLTTLYSQAKAGKSAAIGAMLSAAMTTPTSGHDCLGIVGPNYAKHALLHFDTEQSPYDWQQLVQTSCKRVGLVDPLPWLLSYTFTGLGAQECRVLIEHAVKSASKKFGGVFAIIIDGVADLVTDPNDPEECFPLVTRLHALAIEHNTCVISVLHLNPGAEANTKGRGHLGSQLERKSESNLTMEKDGDEITKLWATKQRGKAITKDNAIAFQWSLDHGMHRSCVNPEAGKSKGGRQPKYDFATFRDLMPKHTEKHMLLGQLFNRISTVSDIPRNTFRDLMAREFDKGTVGRFFDPNSGVSYRLATPPGV